MTTSFDSIVRPLAYARGSDRSRDRQGALAKETHKTNGLEDLAC